MAQADILAKLQPLHRGLDGQKAAAHRADDHGEGHYFQSLVGEISS